MAKPKRGGHVPPPAAHGEWTLRFADKRAADGWEDLCVQAPGATREAWEQLARAPRRPANPKRQHRLRGELSSKTVAGIDLEHWQYEVTGGGRIWYCPDDERGVVWITKATTGHPRETE